MTDLAEPLTVTFPQPTAEEQLALTGDVLGGWRPCPDNPGARHPLTEFDQDRADALFARGTAAWVAEPIQGRLSVPCSPRDYHMLARGRASFSSTFPGVALTCDPTVPE